MNEGDGDASHDPSTANNEDEDLVWDGIGMWYDTIHFWLAKKLYACWEIDDKCMLLVI